MLGRFLDQQFVDDVTAHELAIIRSSLVVSALRIVI